MPSKSVQYASLVCSLHPCQFLLLVASVESEAATPPSPPAVLELEPETNKQAGVGAPAAAFLSSKHRPEAQTSGGAVAAHHSVQSSPAVKPGHL